MAEAPRWIARFAQLERQGAALQRALERGHYDELERAGLLQTFAIAFELSWKTLKDWLDQEGTSVASPREALRGAFAAGLLEDGALWIEMLGARNTLTHSYDEAAAEDAKDAVLGRYAPAVLALIRVLSARVKE